jgi:lipopolysaccharide transport system ATP-binding protein
MSFAIETFHLSKRYAGPEGRASSLREAFEISLKRALYFSQKKSQEFLALDDVSFSVREGEIAGLFGGNGAGKSTLLKVLARLTRPTSGEAVLKGKVAAFLEVGAGFHPEMTGRENVWLNGALLGMSRTDLKKQVPEIAAFAEIESFLDTPVKRYSTGMQMRLALSVGLHLDADILLLDEVLETADEGFQKRCAERLKALSSKGKTVICVSHDRSKLESLCDTLLFLEGGRCITPI